MDDNEWLAQLDIDVYMLDIDSDEYESMEGHQVVICGIYQGYSDLYEMPTFLATAIFDRITGTRMVTGFGKGNPDSPEYDDEFVKRVVANHEEKTEIKTQSTTDVSEQEVEPKAVVNADDIETGNFNGKLVEINNCVIDELDKYGCTLWISCADGYKSYINIRSSSTSDYFPDDLKDGDCVSIIIQIMDDGSYGGTGIKSMEITGTSDINAVYESYKAHCEALDYESVLRDPKGMKGVRCSFSGTIEYIDTESSSGATYVMRTDSGPIVVKYDKTPEPRFIEDDHVTVYGYTDSVLKETYLQLDKVPYVWSKIIVLQ